MNFNRYLLKNYVHKPRIKFLGKRANLTSKHIHQIKEKISTVNNLNVNYMSLKLRPIPSFEEINYINNGGPEKIQDWNKIKYKK
jgi:hypothetical protein